MHTARQDCSSDSNALLDKKDCNQKTCAQNRSRHDVCEHGQGVGAWSAGDCGQLSHMTLAASLRSPYAFKSCTMRLHSCMSAFCSRVKTAVYCSSRRFWPDWVD